MALTGTETLQVLGQTSTGAPAATTETTTTGAIAALASTDTSSTVITALNTVGAGTITAAGIIGKITARGGTQVAAFTDTTDLAANIIAALPSGAPIGTSFQYTYQNNTVFPATITGGTGVTVSGITTIPAKSWVRYLLTYSAANTITLVGIEQGYYTHVGTFTANGATPVTVSNANVTAGSNITITLKTVGGTVSPSVPYIPTITAGTGFTVAGTALDTSVYNYEIRG